LYITTQPDGSTTTPKLLPCWHDEWLAHRKEAEKIGDFSDKHTGTIEEAEVEMSVVIPAFNEEERLEIMLEEAVAFLDAEYGRQRRGKGKQNGSAHKPAEVVRGGYEILIVNDGSRDRTVDVALEFSRKNRLHDVLRVCTLKQNRGKGGAVTHGFRHVRGEYAIFADADGASKFEDLAKLVEGCKEIVDESNRGIAVGSRAYLVGSEAVVKASLSSALTPKTMLTHYTSALCCPKCFNALLPSSPPSPHTSRYLPSPRYTMRIQAFFSQLITTHYTLHAYRRLDLRRRDVDVS
jgi:dolichyl-phosphate beta-glucosyltransferase